MCVCVCVCIYMNFIYDLLYSESLYLLVFGNDRVYVTREQMMLHVVLVRHKAETGLAWEKLQ